MKFIRYISLFFLLLLIPIPLACDGGMSATKVPVATVLSQIVELPHQMKGWQLYSWTEADGWHFTSIYGTNRNKNPEEIFQEANSVSSDMMVIHATGVEAITTVIGKLPRDEYLFWGNLRGAGGDRSVYPPKAIIEAIAEQAKQSGIKLSGPLSAG